MQGGSCRKTGPKPLGARSRKSTAACQGGSNAIAQQMACVTQKAAAWIQHSVACLEVGQLGGLGPEIDVGVAKENGVVPAGPRNMAWKVAWEL